MQIRTIFYIDGFNLYHGLKSAVDNLDRSWNKYNWIDLVKFANQCLDHSHELVAVKYFTATPLEADIEKKQSAFLKANKLINGEEIKYIKGKYYKKQIKSQKLWKMKFVLLYMILSAYISKGQTINQLDSAELLFEAKIISLGTCGKECINETNFLMTIKNTNAYFLNSKGFYDLIFIKVELRDRYNMENYLFLKNLTDSEKIEVLIEPNEEKYKKFKIEKLYDEYKITESTPNKVVESYIKYNFKSGKKNIYMFYAKYQKILCFESRLFM